MNFRTFIVLAVAALTTVGAESISHKDVQPFPQPEAVTDAEKAAVKFKPSIVIKNGCHPYPAVNAAGYTSGGLKGTGKRDGECKGSGWGSQVYSRSKLNYGKWAILYAWYFPKDVTRGVLPLTQSGVRHRWMSVVVWLDDVALETPTVLAISTENWNDGYSIEIPVDRAHLDGTTTKVVYEEDIRAGFHTMNPTTELGEFQDLIQWEQMTNEARLALETTNFGEHNNVPFNDAFFENTLKDASTIYVWISRGHSEPKSIWA